MSEILSHNDRTNATATRDKKLLFTMYLLWEHLLQGQMGNVSADPFGPPDAEFCIDLDLAPTPRTLRVKMCRPWAKYNGVSSDPGVGLFQINMPPCSV